MLRRSKRNSVRWNYSLVDSSGFEASDLDMSAEPDMSEDHRQDMDNVEVVEEEEASELTPAQIEEQIQAEMLLQAELEAKRDFVEQKQKLLNLRARNAQLKQEIHDQGKPRVIPTRTFTTDSAGLPPGGSRGAAGPSRSKPNQSKSANSLLQQIRADLATRSEVEQTMNTLGLDADMSEEDEEIGTSEAVAPGKQAKKSGLLAKPYDTVKTSVMWPHMKLGVRYSTERGLGFDQLDLRLLVAGELEIISSVELSERERWARMNILKDIIYAAGFYEWAAVKRLYVAILTEVEMGIRAWGDDTSRLEQQILMPFPLKPKMSKSDGSGNVNKSFTGSNNNNSGSNMGNKNKKKSGIWFCGDYQKNECSHKESHTIKNQNGKLLVAHHVCGSCWLTDRVRAEHASSSPSCPHFEH